MSDASKDGEFVVACSGNDIENGGTFFGHPKIYIRICAGEEKPCPYCGKMLGVPSKQ